MSKTLPEVPAVGMPDGAWLLDVREDDEWAAGHAPGARYIPLGQLGARTAEIPQDETVYVICRSGRRSERAAEALSGAGWEAVNVAGGMQDWAAARRPMTTDTDTDTGAELSLPDRMQLRRALSDDRVHQAACRVRRMPC